MGNLASYCCKDGCPPDGYEQAANGAEDEREEQSRIWSENVSNQQYGACSPPTSPTVYKIVLPRLLPIEIEQIIDDNNENDVDDDKHTQPKTEANIRGENREQSQQHQASTVGDGNDEDKTTSVASNNSSSKQQQQQQQQQSQQPQQQQPPAVIKEEYCSEQFEHLRSLVFKNPNGQRQFRESLWSCIPWSAPGGKSGSTFMKTVNDQFILKEMSKLELQSFLAVATEYFNYIEDAYNDNKPSLLSTIFGIYRIVYTSSSNQTGQEYYFMVMKNLFHKRNISQRFDLKGSVRNRLTNTSDPDKTEHVLMDENLLLIACDHPLFIQSKSKQILNECIDRDSRFLASIAVMDYSLLVGVDKENQELVLGIIDYVRPFTWDKKIERVVKSVVSSELPTIVEPRLYRERFCEAMDKYFESVPDDWV